MRKITTPRMVEELMRALGKITGDPIEVFFTGGVTAILFEWRDGTVDIDIKLSSDSDQIMRALPRLKEELNINIEFASPVDFIPEVPGWRKRCIFIGSKGPVSFFHYDPYSQALSKLERRHKQDLSDVRSMLDGGLVERGELLRLFEAIEPNLYRYPAVDPRSFRKAVEETVEV